MNKEKVEAKLFKKIDNTYVEITKEQLIISLQEANKSLEQENKQLKKKYENAVSDYEQEHYKIVKAIEYINNGSYFDGSSMCANGLLEILGDKE